MEVDKVYNPDARNKEIEKIAHMTAFLYKKFYAKELMDETVMTTIDLDESNDVSFVFYNLYTYLRKEANVRSANVGNLGGERQVIIGNVNATISVLANEYKAVAGYKAFDFQLATPMVDILTSFKLAWHEIRLSCAQFTCKDANGRVTVRKLTEIGLSNMDVPGLAGITFKTERRSGLAKTLGPLALMIFLAQEQRYKDKLENALRESLKMLPMCESIVSMFSHARNLESTGKVLQAVARVIMVLGSRSHHEIHFPLLFIARSFYSDKDALLKINFSGLLGMQYFNSRAPMYKWTKRSKGLCEDIAQVAFHSIFSTARKDLGILSQITNVASWKTRKELNDVFLKQKEASSKEFTFPQFIYYSRMANSNMIKGLGTLQPQIYPDTVFAGKRKRTYTEAFIKIFEGEKRGHVYSSDPTHLAVQINEFKMTIEKNLPTNKYKDIETVNWFKVEGDKFLSTDFVPTESRQYFYS